MTDYHDVQWPPALTGGVDQVDCLMLNYSPDTGRPDGISPDELSLATEPQPTGEPYTYPNITENNTTACGNCKFYVDGGACALVKGAIDPVNGICKFYEGGTPLPYNIQVFPVYEQPEAAYEVRSYEPYLQEAIATNIIDREHELIADGVPENEVHDILKKEFADTVLSDIINETEWDESKHPRGKDGRFGKGGSSKKSTGSTKHKKLTPPEFVYHSSWKSENIDGLIGSGGVFDKTKAGENFGDHGNVGIGLYTSSNFQNDEDGGGVTNYGNNYVKMDIDKDSTVVDIKDIMKEFGFSKVDILSSAENGQAVLNYAKENGIDIIRDSNYHDAFHIIVNPSKVSGIRRVMDQFDETITETNEDPYTATGSKLNSEPSMHGLEGHLSTNPTVMGYENENPNPDELVFDIPPLYNKETRNLIRETIGELSTQFNWMTGDYLQRVSELGRNVGGRFVLVRASAEAITDHRSQGEPYRRLLKGDELAQLTRTGIGKSTDINHLHKEDPVTKIVIDDYKVDSDVLDAEYDPTRRESQMLVHLRDPEIIHYIETGEIDSVSINAGLPRHMHTECDTGECFVVPRGLVLGELDDIAFTWVVNNPQGVVWRGRHIPPAVAGVKVTKLELL